MQNTIVAEIRHKPKCDQSRIATIIIKTAEPTSGTWCRSVVQKPNIQIFCATKKKESWSFYFINRINFYHQKQKKEIRRRLFRRIKCRLEWRYCDRQHEGGSQGLQRSKEKGSYIARLARRRLLLPRWYLWLRKFWLYGRSIRKQLLLARKKPR